MRLLGFADTPDDGAPGAAVHRYAWDAPGFRSSRLGARPLVWSDSSFPVQRLSFWPPMHPGWLAAMLAPRAPRALPDAGLDAHSRNGPYAQICSWPHSGARRPAQPSIEPLPTYRPDARPRVPPSGPPDPWPSAQSPEASRQHLEASRTDF